MRKEKMIFVTRSFKETRELGEGFVERILLDQVLALSSGRRGVSLSKKSANAIALYGDLGSGKTTFVQGLAKGLGIKRRIISPTFIIIRSYKLKAQSEKRKTTAQNSKLFYHIDLYRTESERDIEGLGIEEIVNDPQNIVAIEWAEKMGRFLPRKRIDIRFAYLSESKRRITVGNLKSQIAKLKTTT